MDAETSACVTSAARPIGRVPAGTDHLGGTAFAIANDLALTAFHCVRSKHNPLVASTERDLKFTLPSGVELPFTVGPIDEVADIALLRLLRPLPTEYRPLRLALDPSPRGAEFQAEGYPGDMPGANPTMVSGRVEDPDAYRNDAPALQLFVRQLLGDLGPGGMSGAPVYLEGHADGSDQWAVGGVICRSPINPRTEKQGLGATAYACPIKIAYDKWSDMISDRLGAGITDVDKRAVAARAELASRAWLNPGVTRPPLQGVWDSMFEKGPKWHDTLGEQIAGFINELSRAQDPSGAFAKIGNQCLRVDFRAEYSVIRAQAQAVVDAATEAFSTLDREGGAAAGSISQQLRVRLVALGDYVRDAPYRRCLLVTGSSGEGKTHLVADLLLGSPTVGKSVIPVVLTDAPRSPDSVADALLAACRTATGVDWPRWWDLAAFASAQKMALTIAVDDLSTWAEADPGLIKDLTREIERSTRYSSVYWLLTTELNGLVYFTGQPEPWARYGVASRGQRPNQLSQDSPTPSVDGWIVLDQVNRENETGATILRSLLAGRGPAADVVADVMSIERFSTPLTAWLFWRISKEREADKLEDLLDLSSADVLQRFWDLLVSAATKAESETVRQVFLAAVGRAVGAFLAARRFKLPEGELSTTMGPESLDHAMGLGLLARVHDPDAIGRTSVRTRYEFVWEYLMARELLDSAENHIETLVSTVEALLPASEFETLTQVVLAMADDLGHSEVWSSAIASTDIAPAVVWFAAARTGAKTQQTLLSSAASRPTAEFGRRDVFALLRFLESVGRNGAPGTHVLDATSPHHELIGAVGLGQFFAYVVEQTLRRVNQRDDLLGCLRALVGSERAWIATADASEIDDIAETAFSAACSVIEDDDECLGTCLDFLAEPDASPAPITGRLRGFRSAFARAIVRHSVAKMGLDAYGFLLRNRWYESEAYGVNSDLGHRMVTEANATLGAWYRAAPSAQKAEYVTLVGDEAGVGTDERTDLVSRINALFLIRHRLVSPGQRSRPLEREFWASAQRLKNDKQLAHHAEAWIREEHVRLKRSLKAARDGEARRAG